MYRGWAVTFFPQAGDAGAAAIGAAAIGAGAAAVGAAAVGAAAVGAAGAAAVGAAGAAAVGAAGAAAVGAGAAPINAIPRNEAFYKLNDVAGQPWLMATDNRINVAAMIMDDE